MNTFRSISLCCAVLTAPVAAIPVSAIAADYDNTIQHQILQGWQQPDGSHIAALDIQLAPGWKTYWRAPGETGIPPEFSWAGSENLKSVGFIWPAPHLFDQDGLRTLGYKDSLTLPMQLEPIDPALPIVLRGQVDMGVCEDICLPVTLPFSADLPLGGGRVPVISAALAARPFSAAEAGVRAVECAFAPTDHGLRLTAVVHMPSAGGPENAVIETADPAVWVDVADTDRKGQTLTVSADMFSTGGGALALERSGITITVLGHDYAVELRGCR